MSGGIARTLKFDGVFGDTIDFSQKNGAIAWKLQRLIAAHLGADMNQVSVNIENGTVAMTIPTDTLKQSLVSRVTDILTTSLALKQGETFNAILQTRTGRESLQECQLASPRTTAWEVVERLMGLGKLKALPSVVYDISIIAPSSPSSFHQPLNLIIKETVPPSDSLGKSLRSEARPAANEADAIVLADIANRVNQRLADSIRAMKNGTVAIFFAEPGVYKNEYRRLSVVNGKLQGKKDQGFDVYNFLRDFAQKTQNTRGQYQIKVIYSGPSALQLVIDILPPTPEQLKQHLRSMQGRAEVRETSRAMGHGPWATDQETRATNNEGQNVDRESKDAFDSSVWGAQVTTETVNPFGLQQNLEKAAGILAQAGKRQALRAEVRAEGLVVNSQPLNLHQTITDSMLTLAKEFYFGIIPWRVHETLVSGLKTGTQALERVMAAVGVRSAYANSTPETTALESLIPGERTLVVSDVAWKAMAASKALSQTTNNSAGSVALGQDILRKLMDENPRALFYLLKLFAAQSDSPALVTVGSPDLIPVLKNTLTRKGAVPASEFETLGKVITALEGGKVLKVVQPGKNESESDALNRLAGENQGGLATLHLNASALAGLQTGGAHFAFGENIGSEDLMVASVLSVALKRMADLIRNVPDVQVRGELLSKFVTENLPGVQKSGPHFIISSLAVLAQRFVEQALIARSA